MTVGSHQLGGPDGPDRLGAWVGQLAVEADLSIDFRTHTDELATGRLTGSGQHLRLDLDRPELLVGELGPALVGVGRSRVGGLTDQLAQARVNVELHGPRGRLAEFDPGAHSRVAALLTGSPHIKISPAAWPVALRSVRPSVRSIAVAGAALAAVILVAASSRRSSDRPVQ